jgi:hypothetical protein
VTVPPADDPKSSDQRLSSDERGPGNRLARTGAGAGVGLTLGRYLLGDVLGHGAMATVFRAHDRQLGRTVAIKVMNLAVAARSDAGERFRREAQAVAALHHPGIVEIHDFVAASGDEPAYIVAELIAGCTLSEVLSERRGRLLPEVALLVVAEVADALAAAHQRGIIHRDIKPDNVMVEKTSTTSRVVITDFGVAHVTGLETMTATGALIGSPAYMSPEQARGHDVGPGADLWATGVMLYQMVTGTLPFPGREPFAVIAAISRGDFRRPSQVQATVSPELERIIVRCLAPDPAQRGEGAGPLAAELRALAREAGLEDGPAALRRFLDDPGAFEAELRPRVADAAVARARRHLRRGELARALSQVGRATAYVPDHHGAEAVVRSVSARRRWARTALVLTAVAALVAAGTMGYRVRMRWLAALNRPALQSPPTGAPPPAPAKAPPSGPPREAAATLPHPRVAASAVRKKLRRSTPAPVVAAPPELVVDDSPLPAPPEPPRPEPARVTLMSTRGLCFPSLDDEPVLKRTPVVYASVTAGRHRVYCDGKLVGEIEVPAGSAITRIIKVDRDGKPRL